MFLPKAERREFLESRRRGIHGSDIAAICGHHPYRDAMDVYLDKVRPVRPDQLEIEGRNIHIWRGRILEEPLRQLFEYLYDRPVQRIGDWGLKVHRDHDWVRAHLDGRQTSTGNHDFETTGALEVKAPTTHGFDRIVEAGIEPYRIMQLQWELHASGYDWGSFAVGNLEDDRGPMLKWDMEPHERLIQQMHERAERFFFECVKPREKPGDEWFEKTRVEMPDVEGGERVEVEDPEMVRATFLLMKAYIVRNQARDLYSERKKAYKALLEDRDLTAINTPFGKVNYKWRSGRTSFDEEKLEKARPLDPDMVSRWLLEAEGLSDVGAVDGISELSDLLVEVGEMDLDRFRSQGDDYQQFRPFPIADSVEELKAIREGHEGAEGD